MALRRDPERNELKVLKTFANFSGKRVLEVGCGEGRLTWQYASSAREVVGIDPDTAALRVARADCPARLQETVRLANASAHRLPFPRETFDIALFSWSL